MAGDEVAATTGGAKDELNTIKTAGTSPLDRKKALQRISKMTPEQIKDLSGSELKEAFMLGADLDDNGKPKQKDSSLKIHIELDLDVEVHLNARVQGDITIGLL